MMVSGGSSSDSVRANGGQPEPRWRLPEAAEVVVAYGALAIFAVLGVITLFIWRSTAQLVYIALMLRPLGFAAFTNAVVLVLALTWIVLVIVVEAWFRTGIGTGRLPRRLALVLGTEAALALLGFAITALLKM